MKWQSIIHIADHQAPLHQMFYSKCLDMISFFSKSDSTFVLPNKMGKYTPYERSTSLKLISYRNIWYYWYFLDVRTSRGFYGVISKKKKQKRIFSLPSKSSTCWAHFPFPYSHFHNIIAWLLVWPECLTQSCTKDCILKKALQDTKKNKCV